VRLTDLGYEDWLEHAVGREVRIQRAAWFFDHDCDLVGPGTGCCGGLSDAIVRMPGAGLALVF
jgi:hypothetical protein